MPNANERICIDHTVSKTQTKLLRTRLDTPNHRCVGSSCLLCASRLPFKFPFNAVIAESHEKMQDGSDHAGTSGAQRDRVISVIESIHAIETLDAESVECLGVPRSGVRCVHVAPEKGKIRGSQGRDGIALFLSPWQSVVGPLHSSVLVSPFTIGYHTTSIAPSHHHDAASTVTSRPSRSSRRPPRRPLLFAGFRPVLRLFDHPRIDPFERTPPCHPSF